MIIILSLEDAKFIKYVLYIAKDLNEGWELVKRDALIGPYRMEMDMRMFEPTEDMMKVNKLSLSMSEGSASKADLEGFSVKLLDTVYSFYKVAETSEEIESVLDEADDLIKNSYTAPASLIYPDLIEKLKCGEKTDRNNYHIATYRK